MAEMHCREKYLKCSKCGLKWIPARITDFIPGKKGLHPIDKIRCVECKTVYNRAVDDVETY